MKAYVFELDGTVYLGNTLLPGAKEAIGKIREEGKRLLFLSNNPLRTREITFRSLLDLESVLWKQKFSILPTFSASTCEK